MASWCGATPAGVSTVGGGGTALVPLDHRRGKQSSVGGHSGVGMDGVIKQDAVGSPLRSLAQLLYSWEKAEERG
jgi:hypothetical protein